MTRASVKISQGEIVFYHLESGLNFKCYRVTFGSMTGFAIFNQICPILGLSLQSMCSLCFQINNIYVGVNDDLSHFLLYICFFTVVVAKR